MKVMKVAEPKNPKPTQPTKRWFILKLENAAFQIEVVLQITISTVNALNKAID